jgi:hypothetical protein
MIRLTKSKRFGAGSVNSARIRLQVAVYLGIFSPAPAVVMSDRLLIMLSA